jgi:hypothetical protein
MVILFNKSRTTQIQVVKTNGERVYLPAMRQITVDKLSDVANLDSIRKMLQIQEVAEEASKAVENTNYLYNKEEEDYKKKRKRGGDE